MGTNNDNKKTSRIRRCTQTQCSFYLEGGCKACEDCGAKPYEINTSCARCLSCENIPNALRFGDNTPPTETEPQKEKIILTTQR